MIFTEITLKDKQLFDRHLKLHNPQVSELTFTNLFAWRNFYRFKSAEINGLLCIIARPCGSEPYALMPIGSLDSEVFEDTYKELRDYFRQMGWKPVFKKIAHDELVYFKTHVNSDEDMVYDRDNSDYLYSTMDLIHLKGKKYDGKRNHINKFKSKYDFSYVPLECSLIDECSRIMEEWCREKNCNCQEGDYCERQANMELLKNFRYLECKGALLYVNGRYEAFTAGEMLNGDTAVIHIEKANTAIPGLYTVINQQFLEKEWKDAAYVNREQDLGLEGMRKAKLSYNPLKMVDKYTVYTC